MDFVNDAHMDVYAAEVAQMGPRDWERWITKVESILGRDVDGDQESDGFSIDGFFILWEEGMAPMRATRVIQNVVMV